MYIHNLGQKFKLVAEKFAERTAVITEAGHTTYQQLDELSDSVAAFFQSEQLNSGDVICIAGIKDIWSLICIIAALKSGIVYSVFDPDSPVERLAKIFTRCAPRLVLCPADLVEEIGAAGFKVLDFKKIDLDRDQSCLEKRRRKIVASSAAYIMFTSGSTGFPKGATMTHQNVLNLIEWSIEAYDFSPEDVLTNVNPLFFDNSVFDLYSSLFTGASLALFDNETVRNPARLMQKINEYKCSSWFSVPSMLIFLQTMRAFAPENMKHIKRIIFGGEGYPKAKLKELFDVYSERIAFYNVYGPTECTCICSSYKVSSRDFENSTELKGFLPLGELIPNFDFLVIDEEMRSVAPGTTGELALRGPNVGLGYYCDPERTKSNFIQNPAHDSFGELLYRTGDLVYLGQDDGKIYIVGRQDNQVKHMGYRIELEEIENALSCIESIGQSAVVQCEVRGLSQIVAFIKCKNGNIDEPILRTRLREIIPNYMIPTRIQFVDQLPKNANGKLDRKKLKADFLEQLMSHG